MRQQLRLDGLLLPLGGVLVWGVIASVIASSGLSNRTVSLLTSVVIMGIAATGLGLLWGDAGQLNLAYAANVGVSAYVTAIGVDTHGASFEILLPLAVVTGAVVGFVVALPALRTSGHYFVILSFAIGMAVITAAEQLNSVTGGFTGLVAVAPGERVLGVGLDDRVSYLRLCIAFAVVVLGLVLVIKRSRWGLTLRGMRDNDALASSLGSNVRIHRTLAFTVTGGIGGVAGHLYTYQLHAVAPSSFGLDVMISILLMVLIGGRRYLFGPLVGASVYYLLPETFAFTPTQGQMVFGVLLVLVILLMPSGILSLGAIARRFVHRRGEASRVELLTVPSEVGS